MGVKGADKKQLDEMRVEVGMKESSKKKFARSIWACHVDTMGDENLTKRANARKLAGN